MELRQLRYFVAVAEEMHFGRAAEKLHVVQPALSRQIAALERELGFPLLERTRRRVAFTPAGELFFHEAKESLQRIDRAVVSAGMTARGELGSLAIGYVASAMWSVLPRILESFLRERPGMTFDLVQLDADVQLQRLRDGLLDVGFIRPLGFDDDVVATETVWREPLVVALPAAHALADRDEIDLGELRDETFLIPSRRRSRALHDVHISLFREHGFSPSTIEANTPSALLLVSLGRALALTPESLRESGARDVVFRPLRPPVPTLELALAYRCADASPAARAFVAIGKALG